MSELPNSLEGKKYPAKGHARNVNRHLIDKKGEKSRYAIFVSGEDLKLFPYSDQTQAFRQNRYFFYLSGCRIPGSHILYLPHEDKLILYIPDVDDDDIMWSGPPKSREAVLEESDIDEVKYASELDSDLAKVDGFTIYTTDINEWNQKISNKLLANDPDLFYALDESRAIKDWYEIELMKKAAQVTDNCHFAVMSAIPIETNETHIHAEFLYHALRQGSKLQSYDPICCSGTNCSTLHYVRNDQDIPSTKRSILLDAGAEWICYASDVTRCFPINGDWTKEHLEIYNLVLKMQAAAMELIRPGADWEHLHLTCHRVLIKEFQKLGIFKSEYSVDEIFENKISAGFFPHGLGHMLGLDTHDVGGRPNYEDPDPLLKFLRIRRKLKSGMVVTNEPGCYFSPYLLEETLESSEKSKYIDRAILDKYWYVGGVRIEDDILVTDNGYHKLTGITSDPAEISKIVKKGLSKDKAFHNVV